MKSILLIFLLGFLINFECISSSEIYNSIFWAPENPLFTKGCSLQLKVRQASTVKFVCPNPATILDTRRTNIQKGNMYENIRIVYDKTRYDSCNATNTTNPNRTTLQFECNDPLALMYFPVVFNPHSAESNTPKFKPGKTYYFLATSDGTASHNKDETGGHCSGNNNITMKFEVYVCNDTSDNVRDPLCNNGVGELQCINEDPSTAPTTITASVSTEETIGSGASQAQRGSDCVVESTIKWKAGCIAVSCLLIVAIASNVIIIIRYKICCCVVRTGTVSVNKTKSADYGGGGVNVDDPYCAVIKEDKKGIENAAFKEEK